MTTNSQLTVSRCALSLETRSILEGYAADVATRARWRRAFDGVFGAPRWAERGKRATAALRLGTCDEVRIEHRCPPLVSPHAHGVIVFIPIAEQQTLMCSISSVQHDPDPRWQLHKDGVLFRRYWRWLRVPRFSGEIETGPLGFVAEGEAIAARMLPELHRDNALRKRVSWLSGWLRDDVVVPLSTEEIEGRAHYEPAYPRHGM